MSVTAAQNPKEKKRLETGRAIDPSSRTSKLCHWMSSSSDFTRKDHDREVDDSFGHSQNQNCGEKATICEHAVLCA